MDSLCKPLERVAEAVEHFVRTPTLKCLYVATTQILRRSVLQHITAAELYEFNTTPFFVFEAATEPGDDGWAVRSDEFRDQWDMLREMVSPDAMDPLWPEQGPKTPLARFGLELARAAESIQQPATGLTIVLSPVWVSDAETWCRSLTVLLNERSLSRIRFIVVETDTKHGAELVETHRSLMEYVDACVDTRAITGEDRARLEAMKSVPAGATGARVGGAAGPDLPPPRRRNQPSPLSHDQAAVKARELGIPAAYLQPDVMHRLHTMLTSAALAARDGKLSEAVRYQREARDFCIAHDMHRESIVNELVLGSYLLQSGNADKALETYRDARRRADAHNLCEQSVLAQMAVGSCLMVLGLHDEAASAYAEAGNLGIEGKSVALAIESFRMCGQIAASRGHIEEAGMAFRRALAVADANPHEAGGSSAPEAARQLAALCRKYGMSAQADALEAQAAALECAALKRPGRTEVDASVEPMES